MSPVAGEVEFGVQEVLRELVVEGVFTQVVPNELVGEIRVEFVVDLRVAGQGRSG